MNTWVQWVALVAAMVEGVAFGLVVVRAAGGWGPGRGRGAGAGSPPAPPGGERRVGVLGIGRVLFGIVDVGVGALLLGTVGVAMGGVDGFGAMAVLWFAAVAGLPALAAVVLVWRASDLRGRRLTRPAAIVVTALVGLGGIGVWGSVIEPYRLQVDRPEALVLRSGRDGREPLRIGVLTDLQTTQVGDHEQAAVDALMAEQPDLILLPGDLIQLSGPERAAVGADVRSLLGRLHAPGGVWLVPGDVDTAWPSSDSSVLDPLVAGTDVRVLRNEVVAVTVGDRMVRIGGVELDYTSTAAGATIEALEQAPEQGDVRILLAHRPDAALRLSAGARTDLVVAGHTHGGQVSLPGFGPPLTLSDVSRAVGAGGLHVMGGQPIYVGHGVGMERGQAPPLRFGVPPDVGLLTIRT